MSYNAVNKRNLVKRVLPEYKLLGEAPDKIPEDFNASDEAREFWIKAERQRRYKASNEDGDILLVMNPFVWEEKEFSETTNGFTRRWKAKYRPKPETILTYNQALKLLGDKEGEF